MSSYVRWPDAVRPLVYPIAPVRYMFDYHRMTCCALQLWTFLGEFLVAAPAHGLPIEYVDRGTLWGNPVSGFAC